MTALSPWLQLMLAEIARKQEEAERGQREAAERAREALRTSPPPAAVGKLSTPTD
ncbi:MAG: hypothetical protein JSS29_17550 [Proteobacteria bacterium]|nr:hypothetical protein [Pseudomonadota bacterium]